MLVTLHLNQILSTNILSTTAEITNQPSCISSLATLHHQSCSDLYFDRVQHLIFFTEFFFFSISCLFEKVFFLPCLFVVCCVVVSSFVSSDLFHYIHHHPHHDHDGENIAISAGEEISWRRVSTPYPSTFTPCWQQWGHIIIIMSVAVILLHFIPIPYHHLLLCIYPSPPTSPLL